MAKKKTKQRKVSKSFEKKHTKDIKTFLKKKKTKSKKKKSLRKISKFY